VDTQLLEEIRDEIKAGNVKTPLGFGHPPKPRYIYANRQYPDCLWYFWRGDRNEHESIELHAITGTIVKLDIETKEFRGKPDPKVNLTIKADRTYIIQAGFDTLFAKGLLYSLASNKMQNFDTLWTIAVEPGETEQVLFCRIYDPVTGESVYAPYPDDVDWPSAAAKAQAKLGQATSAPEAPQTAAPKAKPVASKPVAKALEPAVVEEEESHAAGIEYEYSIEDDAQIELVKHRSQREFSEAIALMTVNSSVALGAELAAATGDNGLGICHGQVQSNFDSQLKRLKAAIERVKANATASGIPLKSVAAALGAKGDDCTLVVLVKYADSIEPVKVLDEIAF
jgi:hypothetical protein